MFLSRRVHYQRSDSVFICSVVVVFWKGGGAVCTCLYFTDKSVVKPIHGKTTGLLD